MSAPAFGPFYEILTLWRGSTPVLDYVFLTALTPRASLNLSGCTVRFAATRHGQINLVKNLVVSPPGGAFPSDWSACLSLTGDETWSFAPGAAGQKYEITVIDAGGAREVWVAGEIEALGGIDDTP